MTLEFGREAVAAAPVEEVWKLLYDPARMSAWWIDVGAVSDVRLEGGDSRFTMHTPGDDSVALPQQLRSDREQGRIVVSCLTHGISFRWRLEVAGAGTRVGVTVEVPPDEAFREPALRRSVRESLARLIALAERAAR